MMPLRLPVCCVLAVGLAASAVAQDVTLESLLREMVDRDAVANYPELTYQCLQASSYNRESVPPRGSEGWFADSDGIGFIRKEGEGRDAEWVIMEHNGPGCLTKFWTPYFYYGLKNLTGPMIRIYLDGAVEPVIEENFIELLTQGSFDGAPPIQNKLKVPYPFAGYTARAGDLYLPIPFAENCKVTLDDKPFYNIVNYRAYPDGTQVETFSRQVYRGAASALAEVGKELTDPTEAKSSTEEEIEDKVAPGGSLKIDLAGGSHALRHLEIKLGPDTDAQRLRSTVLKMECDGEQTIWVPVGDFFCSGETVNPFRMWEREVRDDGAMTCRWVMPWKKSAQIVIENLGPKAVDVSLRVVVGAWNWDDNSMHFRANWRIDDPVPGTPFLDWNFIDITGKGVYAGDAWSVLAANTGWWGEGDEKIYIDDDYDVAKWPSHFGTGTEDYYGWAGGRVPTGKDAFSMPFISNVRVGNPANPRGYNICTRTRVLDAIPFTTRLRFDIEASFGVQMRNPWDLLHYSATIFWYARPGATHNRTPQPEQATQPAMTVEELTQQEEALKAKAR